MTKKQQLAAVGVASLLIGSIAGYKVVEVYPFHNHDEPIIIDNGPLDIDFKSKGRLTQPHIYVRDQACRIYSISWLHENGTKGGPVPLGSESITLLLKAQGKDLNLYLTRVGPSPSPDDTTCLEKDSPPYVMLAMGLKFARGGFLGLDSKRAVADDALTKSARIYGISYYAPQATESTTVPLRDAGSDGSKPVRVEIHTPKK